MLTFVSPVPPNEPLYWHVMGEKAHLTVQVTPKAPGDNQFRIDVWMKKELGKPKEVHLGLQDAKRPDIAPIEVPLAELADTAADESFTADETYGQYSYKAEGPFIPFPGMWKLEFRLLDQNDDEIVYRTETRVY